MGDSQVFTGGWVTEHVWVYAVFISKAFFLKVDKGNGCLTGFPMLRWLEQQHCLILVGIYSCSRNFGLHLPSSLPACLRLVSSLIWWRKFPTLLQLRQRHIGNPVRRAVQGIQPQAIVASIFGFIWHKNFNFKLRFAICKLPWKKLLQTLSALLPLPPKIRPRYLRPPTPTPPTPTPTPTP